MALATCAAPLHAQLSDRLEAALRAIYADNAYPVKTLGPVQWLDGGTRYTTVTSEGDVVAHETASGSRQTLVSAADLTPSGTGALAIAGYSFSADGSKVLVFTNTQRVWRANTRGDYWVFDRPSRRLRKLGGGAPGSSLMFAEFSPDGSGVAYVRDQNIYVENVNTGRITQLTTDGGGDVINGTSDWVNEEELLLRNAFRWSPDGRFIAYWQFDTSRVGRFTLINNTDSLYPVLKQFPYPKAGTTNSRVRVGAVPARGGRTVWFRTPGDPREHYIPRLEWADAQTVVFSQTTRRQNSNELMFGDARTGTIRRVYGERSLSWIDSADPLVLDDVHPVFWLDDGREFTWVSDKDGWRHVYAVARDGAGERLLTKFAGDAMRIVTVDNASRRLYFMASPDNATQRYLFAADTHTGDVRRITPPGSPGTHVYNVSPDGKWALQTYSRADVPPRTVLVSLPEHVMVRELVTNEQLEASAVTPAEHGTEFFQVTIGDHVTLDAMLLKPSFFDPARKYPLIVFAYTEPGGTSVDDRWTGPPGMFRRALAEEGYLVAAFENRGTPVPKGAAWRKVVYGALGEFAAKEQAMAVRAFASERPYVDIDRIGIYGTSAGGQAVLFAMFRFPDLYKVGVAMAPGPVDKRLYDTIYQERYLGLPDENPEGYFNSSPINFAEGLRGRLLVIHGTGDDNVHFQSTERLVNKLVELGKDFDLMIYPNRTHALSEGKGTALHRWRTVARYFVEHLPPSRLGPRGEDLE